MQPALESEVGTVVFKCWYQTNDLMVTGFLGLKKC
jgi:hypothetical protein